MIRTALIVAATAFPAGADCPPVADVTAEIDAILEDIRSAPDGFEAQMLGNELWSVWARAPDDEAQRLLDRGLQARARRDFVDAVTSFDALVAYCPDYAEGYNQRAFVSFIQGDYANALEDLERALERSPLHVAAMTGRGLALMQLGRTKASQAALREALALNPWLPERAFLIDEDGTAPAGKN